MTRRRILLIAVAGLVLLIGGLALTVALIPEERVADAVARRAEGVLGEPVAIERVGISIFPLPGVRLTDVSVGRADSTALARVDRAEVRVRILPLLGGRVVVRRLDLDAPRIAVQIDREGVANFPVLEPDTTAEPSTADIDFAVDEVRITDGVLRYTNLQDSTRVRIDGWSQELSLSGAVEAGELTSLDLAGWIAFDDIEADLPGVVLPARDLALRVEHDATLELADDRLELRELAVDFDGVTVAGSGRVLGVNSGRPEVHIELAAENLEADRLLAWVPDSLRARLVLPDGRPVGLRGTAGIQAAIDGTVAPDTLPAVDGRLTLDGVAVTVGDAAVLEEVAGQTVFSLDSVVSRLDGRLLGEPFNAGLALRDPAAPLAVVALSGRADLGRLQTLGVVPDTLGLAGDVRIDLRAQAPVEEPGRARATGTIDASEITIAGMVPAVRVPTAAARFDGSSVRINPFRVELGPDRSAITMDITADGWIPAAVDSTAPPPEVRLALEAEPLDLDALLGPNESGYAPLFFARLRDRPIGGRTAAAIAEEMGLGLPALPDVDARIDARFERLVRNGLTYNDLTALARITPSAVTLEQLRFGLMGGIVDASAELRPLTTDTAGVPMWTQLEARYGVTGVGSGPFFDTLTPFKGHLGGSFDLAGTLGMVLDRVALPQRRSLEADGTAAISEGRLTAWAVLDAVGDRLGVAAFDTLRFRDWAARFSVEGTRVTLAETAIEATGLTLQAGGWFDLSGQLDVQATAALEPELARQAGAVRQLLAAAPDKRVPVGLHIHGNVERPDVALDLNPVRERVTDRATEAAEKVATEAERRARETAQEAEKTVREAAGEAAEDVRGQAEAGLEGAAERVTGEAAERYELPDSLRGLPADSLRQILGDSVYQLLPDSVRLRADSLQKALENALRERLRRLLPGGGGGDGG